MKNQYEDIQTSEEEPTSLNKQIIVNIQINKSLISEKIQQMINSEELVLTDYVNCDFIEDKIELNGPEKSVLLSEQMIIDTEQQLKSQLIIKQLDLTAREVNFFIKKIQPCRQTYYNKNYRCKIEVIEDKMYSKNIIAQTLKYEGKELNIAFADISNFECDAIVNSCNNLMSFGKVDMSSGVAKNIFDMAGPSYTQFCESYIKENKTLEYGKAITYQIPSQSNVVQKYIINVSTPIYQNGVQTNQDFLNIEQNIKAIFVEANKLNIKTLALPIFGGGASGYAFKQIAENVLIYIINAFYSQDNKTVQKVYITELEEQKLTQICQIMVKIVETPAEIRQVKYQWQWSQGNQFQDYDEEINRQIDERYEQFLNQGSTQELKLFSPFAQQPGTHLVDLQKMTITDKDQGTNIQLSIKNDEGKYKFLFDRQEIEDEMNEYMILQKENNNNQFQISFNLNKLIFNSNGDIQQHNEKTGFSRKVRNIPYQKIQQLNHNNILLGKNVELQQINERMVHLKPSYKIFIESFDSIIIDNLQKKIQQDIKKHTIDCSISIPLLKQESFNHLKAILIQKIIKSYGEIENGKKVTVQILNGKQQMIQALIDKVIDNAMRYPSNWDNQDINAIKVDLPSDSQEYQQIEAEFQKTEQGKISKIFRLQNLRLWEYYQSEVQKLQDLSIQRNTPLTQIELDRYLWHGIKGQHPKLIYESSMEGFDTIYNNEGMKGFYFSQQANYYRSSTYCLTDQDDPLYAGQLVVLCCKVATGKVYTSNSANTLKRPPDGYDCINAPDGGSNMFILFQMDVRRAYPAYEIIYQ